MRRVGAMVLKQTLGGALARGAFERRREAVGIDCGGRSIRYAELDAAAHTLAASLERLGTAPMTNIGILANDTSLIVPAMLGIMARGCVFAMLEPGQPPSVLRQKVQATGLRFLFVESDLMAEAQDALAGLTLDYLTLDTAVYARALAGGSVMAKLDAASGRPLYLYFTSGTAGPPKPILGRADSLLHFVMWEIETFGLDETLRAAQLTPPSHDPFLRDIFVPLITGGTICVPETRQVVLSPVGLGDWLETAGIVLMHCTPTVFRNLCNGPLTGTRFPRLKHVLIAGEQLRGAHLTRWYDAFGDRIGLVNLYGPTETTLAKLFYRIAPPDARRSAIPIGQPITGTDVRIMAAATEEAAPGEVGELVIETAFGTLGYFRRPDLNATVFGCDPSSAMDRPVCYRTGDLVRRLQDGMIEFVGRRDRLGKIRGKRIDLGEVEDALLSRTAIRSVVAAVLSSEVGAGPDQLVAFYVSDSAVNEPEMRERLARDLPSVMIPDAWVRVDALPTNSSAKIDVDELATLFAAHGRGAENGTSGADANGSDISSRLLAIWREILRNNEIGLDDPFMEAGGDSLRIMLLIARLEEDFEYELSLWQIFDGLTARKLCSLINEAGDGAV